MSLRWSLGCFLVVVTTCFFVILARRFGGALRRQPLDRAVTRMRTVLGVARTGLGLGPLFLFSALFTLVALGDLLRVVRVFGGALDGPALDVLDAARDGIEVCAFLFVPVWALLGVRARRPPGDPAHARPALAAMIGATVLADLASGPARWSPARALVSELVAAVAPLDHAWIPRAATALHFALLALTALMMARGALGDPIGLALRAFLRPLPPTNGRPSDASGFGVTPEHRARTAEYRAQFARDGRVRIVDLLPREVAEALAAEVPNARFKLEVNSRIATTYPGAPACSGYLAMLTPHARCDDPSCAALCRFGASLLEGELLDWLREITAMPSLHNRPTDAQTPLLAAQAHPKGGYIAPHTDHASHQGERVAIAMIWHAVARWDDDWGGLLRLYRKADGFDDRDRAPRELRGYELDETWAPRFNELHVFALGAHRVHEVTLVTGDEVRYTLAGRLYEPPPAA